MPITKAMIGDRFIDVGNHSGDVTRFLNALPLPGPHFQGVPMIAEARGVSFALGGGYQLEILKSSMVYFAPPVGNLSKRLCQIGPIILSIKFPEPSDEMNDDG